MNKSKLSVSPEGIGVLSFLLKCELVGLTLSKAFRSFSSMAVLDFGTLREVPSLLPDRPPHKHGELSLVIEYADWRMQKPDGSIEVSERSDNHDIDRALKTAVGDVVESADLKQSLEFAILFRSGRSLLISPSNDIGDVLSQWMISGRGRWWVAVDSKTEIQLSAK